MPMGCRWCGTPQREHSQRWTPDVRWHGYEQPTRQQIADRLRAKFGLPTSSEETTK